MDYSKPVSGKELFKALEGKDCIVMAANMRISHSARGVMMAAKEKNAAVLFEIAKSEVEYTGQTPQIFMDNILKTAKELKFNQPYAVHGDHITVKDTSPEAYKGAEDLIKAELAAGFTSFAIDASHNFNEEAKTTREQLADNISITTKLAALIPKGAGLEVEVGEVGRTDPKTGKQLITTVDEAVTFIKAVQANGVRPDLLAINNGSIHGNMFDKEGNILEQVSIDTKRTEEIVDAIRPLGVKLAQHGITGTPLRLMHLLIEAGISKGNVGTNWQNIVVEHMDPTIRKKMEDWTLQSDHAKKMKAKKPEISQKELIAKNIKHSIKVFKAEIDGMDRKYVQKIHEATKKSALEFFDAFNAEGTAGIVKDYLEK
ncbi:MAG: class II fructose-bisphosphate aldolase [Candidatus Altiarchaeota archaeon]